MNVIKINNYAVDVNVLAVNNNGNVEYHLVQKEFNGLKRKCNIDVTSYIYKALNGENLALEAKTIFLNRYSKYEAIPTIQGMYIPDYRVPFFMVDCMVDGNSSIENVNQRMAELSQKESYMISQLLLVKANDSYFVFDENSRISFNQLRNEDDLSTFQYNTYYTDIVDSDMGMLLINDTPVEITSLVEEKAHEYDRSTIKCLDIYDYLTEEEKERGFISSSEIEELLHELNTRVKLKLA